jgi:hypothetical protein
LLPEAADHVGVPHLSPRGLSATALVLILIGSTTTWAVASPGDGPVSHASKQDDRDKGKWGTAEDGANVQNGESDDVATGGKSKSKDKDKGGGSTTTTVGAPAPAPAPSAPTTSAPATTTAPGATIVPAAPAPALSTAAPQQGVSVGLAGVSGTVLVRTAAGALQSLDAAGTLPTGAHVDATNGTVALTSAIDAQGTTQTGEFSGGVFAVRQSKSGRGTTQLVLLGGKWGACRASAAPTQALAHAAKRRHKPIRSLWGKDDHGRFETRGRGSVATVRGTRWLTEDFCDGTRTTVKEGAVAVRNRSTGRVTVVRAGHSLFVRRAAK